MRRIIEREDRRNIEDRIADDHGERALHERHCVPGQNVDERNAQLSLRLGELFEGRRLDELNADIESDRDEDGARQEWNAPSEGEELCVIERERQKQK